MMSKEKKPKNKTQKGCLGNPFLSSNSNKSSEKQNQLTESLRKVLKDLYPPNITTSMALNSLEPKEKVAILKAPKSERGEKLKRLKMSLRDSKSAELLPKQFRESLAIGVKQFLTELEKDALCAIIFDNSVNFPAIRSVVDKGKVAIAGVQDLGRRL